jgi:hypothetical protein
MLRAAAEVWRDSDVLFVEIEIPDVGQSLPSAHCCEVRKVGR